MTRAARDFGRELVGQGPRRGDAVVATGHFSLARHEWLRTSRRS
ncbi:MAG TPA: hypothetical protein VGN81_07360 [Pseudonocardiaceae bacterium]